MGKSTKHSRKKKRQPLLLQIMSRLGQLDVREAYIPREGKKRLLALWEKDGNYTRITINPVPDIVDSIIHEIIHELYPDYSERAVRSLTGKLMAVLTEEEEKMIYSEYKRKIGKEE